MEIETIRAGTFPIRKVDGKEQTSIFEVEFKSKANLLYYDRQRK